MALGLASPGADGQQVDGRGCLLMPNKQEMAPYVYHPGFQPGPALTACWMNSFRDSSHSSSCCFFLFFAWFVITERSTHSNSEKGFGILCAVEILFWHFLCDWATGCWQIHFISEDKLDPKDWSHVLDSYNTSHLMDDSLLFLHFSCSLHRCCPFFFVCFLIISLLIKHCINISVAFSSFLKN